MGTAFCLSLLSPNLPLGANGNVSLTQLLEVGPAEARERRRQARRTIRRTARRTARRVERRHNRYRSLPSNCVIAVIGGVRYWFCNGIYYRQTTDNGQTVYIIVNP